MSTYYYLACDKHRAISRVIGGRSFPDRWWSNDGGELEEFLEAHAGCEPRPTLISEHDDRSDEYGEVPMPGDDRGEEMRADTRNEQG